MLLGSVISETSDNLTGVPGSKSYVPLHITFTKTGENVQIREINAEDMARQTAAAHRVQRLMTIYNYMYTTN